MSPAFIERLDDHLSGAWNSVVTEMDNPDSFIPVIETRPHYPSLYITHSVLVWFESHPVSFPVASREQAECIASTLNAKGIEARWTAREACPPAGSVTL
ncbi:hypothetical protein H2241_23610 [Pantoea ananatis]|uniref:hypothetical protein n=1 Tax=Pantoea ananas TaxID=553 RepID=UPI00158D11D8|nr:hypothetical protein [Pantoea ananatis]MBA4823894.1 hypothetical protein [Pantoea ananatis]